MMLLVLSAALYAQKEVTKFLGIPVDGTKAAMIQKLKAKGFTTSPYDREVLVGTFNGERVNVRIGTNKGKVCRIMVCDANTMNETDIKIRYNTLCAQFKENKKYMSLGDFVLAEDEDIAYGMTIEHKRYQADFFQLPSGMNEQGFVKAIMSSCKSKYTEEQYKSFTEEQKKEMSKEIFDKLSKCWVWFVISEHYGQYYISMFYDNVYNEAHGEDL